MKTLFSKHLIFVAVFFCSLCPASLIAAQLTLEQKQETPKMMKGRNWNLLKYDNGDIIAYEHTYSEFTLVRFDKTFNIKQEYSLKKAPYQMAYINADGQQIDAVLYDQNNNVQHVAFDKNTLSLLKSETLIEQQKYGKFCVKYNNVYVKTSPNGKYIAVLAMWDHASVAQAFNSNHLYLYNDKFEKIGNWSIDEDQRGVSLKSKENAALWQQYYPNFIVNDDGTVVYAALSDFGSNLYSTEFGSGSSLKVHVLSTVGDKAYDFGIVAEKQHLQAPYILSYDGSQLLLTTDIYNYPPAKVNSNAEFVYKIQGYCLLTCDLTANTCVKEIGSYDGAYTSVVETTAWNRVFADVNRSAPNGMSSLTECGDNGRLFTDDRNNQGIVLMDTNGKNRKVLTFGYEYTQKNKGLVGSAESHIRDLMIDKAVFIESNGTLCTTTVNDKFYWVVRHCVSDGSWSKEKYETSISVREVDLANREVKTSSVFQEKAKEWMAVQTVCMSEGKYLVLIDGCQWGTLEL